MDKFRNLGIVGKILQSLAFIKGARWLPPSESKADADCAVMEFDIELGAERVAFMGTVTMVLRYFMPRLDTDHPIFQYLGDQQVKGEPSRVTATLSIKRTEEGQ